MEYAASQVEMLLDHARDTNVVDWGQATATNAWRDAADHHHRA